MPAGLYHGKNRLIPASGINLPTLPMLVMFFVHACACVEGWMVENAEFYGIFVHYQYSDCAKAHHEPNMHTKRPMLHRTLNTAEPSDAYLYFTASSEPRSAQCMKYDYILAVEATHIPCPEGVLY